MDALLENGLSDIRCCYFVGGVSILFGGGYLEIEIFCCWGVYFLGGTVNLTGG